MLIQNLVTFALILFCFPLTGKEPERVWRGRHLHFPGTTYFVAPWDQDYGGAPIQAEEIAERPKLVIDAENLKFYLVTDVGSGEKRELLCLRITVDGGRLAHLVGDHISESQFEIAPDSFQAFCNILRECNAMRLADHYWSPELNDAAVGVVSFVIGDESRTTLVTGRWPPHMKEFLRYCHSEFLQNDSGTVGVWKDKSTLRNDQFLVALIRKVLANR